MTVTAQSGPSKGATFAAMLRDLSDVGGICVLLDGDSGLTRGAQVEFSFADGPSLSAWVCHNSRDHDDIWLLGVSFAPVEVNTPEQDVSAVPRAKLR